MHYLWSIEQAAQFCRLSDFTNRGRLAPRYLQLTSLCQPLDNLTLHLIDSRVFPRGRHLEG